MAVVGPSEAGEEEAAAAEHVGRLLGERGAVVVCGGLGGAMEAACRGAKAAGGTTVGILPGADRAAANAYVDVALATGLGEARNAVVARCADVLIAVGGAYGTLSEIALALRVGKPVVGLDTWELARSGRPVADIARAGTPHEAVELALVPLAGPADSHCAGVGLGVGFARPGPIGGVVDSSPMADQSRAPYLEALRAYAERDPGRLHVPGHKGGPGADPELVQAIGERALAMDIPALTWGIDTGPQPTPFEEAQELAAEAWGAARSWFLINGASQGNHVALLALAHAGESVVVQRNAHSSTVDGCILAGLTPTFVSPELDPELGIAHCLSPDALDRALAATPDAVGATAVSPTYFGAVADVAALADVAHAHGVPLVVDEAWGAHLAFHEDLPAHALACGADIVVSSTHKIVGSLTQSAVVHLGHAASGRIDASIVDRAVTLVESTSPNSLLLGSLDAARRLAATDGHALLGETIAAMAEIRASVRAIEGLDVLDARLVGAPGVHGYDPLRLAIDVRGTGANGYDVAALLRDRDDIVLELAGENVMVGVFGMAEPAGPQGRRLIAALNDVIGALVDGGDRTREEFALPPPWGDLAMSPRQAFLGPQEAVEVNEAVGRIAAESLAAYPPGIPNVLPGERLTAETLAYIQTAIEHGGSLRGASDRKLRTVRVVAS